MTETPRADNVDVYGKAQDGIVGILTGVLFGLFFQ